MARTLTRNTGKRNTGKQVGRNGTGTRRRERTLGTAVALAVAATLSVCTAIFIVLMLLPTSALHNYFLLAHYNSSPTLRDGVLYRQWAEAIQWQDDLIVTPLGLFCGGLTLGLLAPGYSGRGRVLRTALFMALGLVAAVIGFLLPATVSQQNRLNEVGGHIVLVAFPPELLARWVGVGLLWSIVCGLGAWVGLWRRDLKKAS